MWNTPCRSQSSDAKGQVTIPRTIRARRPSRSRRPRRDRDHALRDPDSARRSLIDASQAWFWTLDCAGRRTTRPPQTISSPGRMTASRADRGPGPEFRPDLLQACRPSRPSLSVPHVFVSVLPRHRSVPFRAARAKCVVRPVGMRRAPRAESAWPGAPRRDAATSTAACQNSAEPLRRAPVPGPPVSGRAVEPQRRSDAMTSLLPCAASTLPGQPSLTHPRRQEPSRSADCATGPLAAALQSAGPDEWRMKPTAVQTPAVDPDRARPPLPCPPAVAERLARLAPDQRAAATAPPGPVLCIAPAGAARPRPSWRGSPGSSRPGADPATIAAITFNARAAEELRERVGAGARAARAVARRRRRPRPDLPRPRARDPPRRRPRRRPLVAPRPRPAPGPSRRPTPPPGGASTTPSPASSSTSASRPTRSPRDPAPGPVARAFVAYERALAAAGAIDFDDLVARRAAGARGRRGPAGPLAGPLRPPPRRRGPGRRSKPASAGPPAGRAGEPDLPRRRRRPEHLRLAPRRRPARPRPRGRPARPAARRPRRQLPLPGARPRARGPAGRAQRASASRSRSGRGPARRAGSSWLPAPAGDAIRCRALLAAWPPRRLEPGRPGANPARAAAGRGGLPGRRDRVPGRRGAAAAGGPARRRPRRGGGRRRRPPLAGRRAGRRRGAPRTAGAAAARPPPTPDDPDPEPAWTDAEIAAAVTGWAVRPRARRRPRRRRSPPPGPASPSCAAPTRT